MDTPATSPANGAPPPAPESRLWLNVLTMVAAVLIIGAIILAFKGRDLYHYYVADRSAKMAQQAMTMIEAEHYEAASQLLREGYRLTPDDPALGRAFAELFFRAYNDHSTAISFLRKTLSSPSGTTADRRRIAEILLSSGETGEARRFYSALPAAEQTGRKGLELLAGIMFQSGEKSEAESLLRKALTLSPDDLDAQLRLAILDEGIAMEQARTTASAKIWTLARRQDEVALKAMSHLSQSNALTVGQAKELRTLVEKHPLAKDKQRYVVLHTYLRLNPLDHDAVVQAEADRNKSRPASELFDYLRWLGTEGEYERLIKTIPGDAVLRDADIFLVYVDAMTAAGRWKEMLAIMLAPRKPPLTPATTHLILAQCYAKLKPDLADARRELAAVLNAGGKPELSLLQRASSIAESLHMYDLAVQGLKVIAQARPGTRIQMQERIFELQSSARNLDGMFDALRQLHELRPSNATYVDKLNYLRLVNGLELEPAYDAVLGTQAPTVTDASAISSGVPQPLLRALAALRFGDLERMKTEAATIANPERMPAGYRAVVAALYTLSGRDVEGFRLAEKVPPGLLIDGEKRFLRRSIR